MRALVVSLLSAGIASGLTDALNLPRGTQLAGAEFGTQFQTYAVQTLTAAGVNAAVHGTSFGTAARNALVTALGQTLTTQIGDVAQANGVASGDVIKALAHAGVQCAEASLTGRDCASAALGGATAELLAPITNRIGTSTKTSNIRRFASLAALTNTDVASKTQIFYPDAAGVWQPTPLAFDKVFNLAQPNLIDSNGEFTPPARGRFVVVYKP